MKLADLFDKSIDKPHPFRSHSENDLISSIKKVLDGAHFNTLGFELKSTHADLSKGLLKFGYKNKHYKIDHDGNIYEGSKVIDKIKPSSDIHNHYTSALHVLNKKFKKEK